MGSPAPAEIVYEALSPLLGKHTARTAVKTFSERTLRVPPEQLTTAQIAPLLEGMRPSLQALLGAAKADDVIGKIRWQLSI